MAAPRIAIKRTGLVTPVGLTGPASCAAFRAKVTNPTQTRFMDGGGRWLMAHEVSLEAPWRGLAKLARMAAMAIAEALDGIPKDEWASIPLLLCLAEPDRPGRTQGLEEELFARVQQELDARFAPESALVPHGRVAAGVGVGQARALLAAGRATRVLLAGTDSLLSWPTLQHYEHQDRLLVDGNSNGFIPGEAAGAVLLGAEEPGRAELVCTGIGFGREAAAIASEEPLRGDGLSQAILAALAEARLQLHDMDFRITDLSGEQYYFKEAALAMSRCLRQLKEEFDIWHPAECIGETGAASGLAVLVQAHAACLKQYAVGPRVLTHMANDAGQRVAMTFDFRAAA